MNAELVVFQRPILFALGVLPVVGAGLGWVWERRNGSRERFATPAALAALRTHSAQRHRWPAVFRALAWFGVVTALAGPRWGTTELTGLARGHDLILVLDVSRSMLASDTQEPTRAASAIRAGLDLTEAARRRGGHRLGLVVFAARPVVLVPLTSDLDHVREALVELTPETPPVSVRLDDRSPSGTRIGRALAKAVQAFDDQNSGSQALVVLTDGDDPVLDREWSNGVTAARQAGVPVHAIGFGDPERDSPVPGVAAARTQLNEALLLELTTEARGRYLPARRDRPDMLAFLRDEIEATRIPRELIGPTQTEPQNRASLFLLAAAVCMLVSLLWPR